MACESTLTYARALEDDDLYGAEINPVNCLLRKHGEVANLILASFTPAGNSLAKIAADNISHVPGERQIKLSRRGTGNN